MDTDRVLPTLLQSESEVTSPVHALGEDTIQPDPSNPSHRDVLRTTATGTLTLATWAFLLHCHLQALRSLMTRHLCSL
jgi:hypothetical protein